MAGLSGRVWPQVQQVCPEKSLDFASIVVILRHYPLFPPPLASASCPIVKDEPDEIEQKLRRQDLGAF